MLWLLGWFVSREGYLSLVLNTRTLLSKTGKISQFYANSLDFILIVVGDRDLQTLFVYWMII